MRLVDADQMVVDESEAYMSAQVQITDDLKWLVNFAAHSKIQKLIADTPTVDAVPVVRCKDCKYRDGTPGQPNILCAQMHEDDFCSYGECREDKDEK